MEHLKKTGEFLGNLVVGVGYIVFASVFVVTMVGLWLRLIHFALGGYAIWTS
jgi:hypothetical protein